MTEEEFYGNWEIYKKREFDFFETNVSYEDRVGPPDELSSVIGLICMSFQRLEDVLSAFIIEMMGTDVVIGKIVVAELSFTNKVNIFSSLFHSLKDSRKFNVGVFDRDEYFKELRKSILKCQEMRNQVIHSSFLKNFKTDQKIIRNKISAKAKNGLAEIEEEVNIPYLFDISDHIISKSLLIEEFFIDFNPKRKKSQNEYISTELSDIFKFRV